MTGVPIPERNGFDLELTIDSRAQYLAERLLGDSNGAIVLLDASDGAVLGRKSGDIIFSEKDLALGGLQQTADQIQCRTFATARGT